MNAINTIPNYYYFGEWGFFNIEILGALEHYFALFPEKRITILTFTDYGLILKLLYPKNITIHNTDIVLPNIPNNRSGHMSCIDNQFMAMRLQNLMQISKSEELLPFHVDEYASTINAPHEIRPRLFYRSTPLVYNLPNLPTNNIVCICPRYRKHFSGKNLLDREWDIVLNKIRKKYPSAQIVALGKKEELLSLDNIIYANNIYEHIHYLNNCDFAVFPDSGMAEFASNCACKVIKVIYKKKFYHTYSLKYGKSKPKPLLHGFNPFGIKIEKYSKPENLIC